MELMGAVIVALLGACVGLLVGLFLQGARNKLLAEQAIAQRATTRTLAEQAGQQDAAALALLEKQHAELRGQLMAMTAALAERMQLVGSALAAALREANAEHRNDLRLALGLPRASGLGDEPPATRPPTEPRAPLVAKATVDERARTTPGRVAPPPTRPSTPPPRPAPLPKPAPPPRPGITAAPIAPASSRHTPTGLAAPTSHFTRPANHGDDPTPPSGWSLEQIRMHTATAGEERRS